MKEVTLSNCRVPVCGKLTELELLLVVIELADQCLLPRCLNLN